MSNYNLCLCEIVAMCILQLANDDSAQKFLSGWHDNHVRMLFFATRERATQRFLAVAFAHRHRVQAGYVNMQLRLVNDSNVFIKTQPALP